MSFYWAKFEKVGNDTFRFDTRAYLVDQIDKPRDSDKCIGAIVGKNPGSAKKKNISDKGLQKINLSKNRPPSKRWQKINLCGDNLLPTVRSIVKKAYDEAKIDVLPRCYIQILNLFYLRDSNLDNAIKAMKKHHEPKKYASEEYEFPWVWYVWGKENKCLSKYKKRFYQNKSNSKIHFFFDQKDEKMKNPPEQSSGVSN